MIHDSPPSEREGVPADSGGNSGCRALGRINALKFRRDFGGGTPWEGQKRREATAVKFRETCHGWCCCEVAGCGSERALPLVRGLSLARRCNFGYGEENY